MPKRRDIKLDQYGISAWRFRELYAYCMQYPQKKRDAIRHAGTDYGVQCAEDVALIDRLIDEVASGYQNQMRLHLTKPEHPYYNLLTYYDIPCSEGTFNAARRRFFYLLAQSKK